MIPDFLRGGGRSGSMRGSEEFPDGLPGDPRAEVLETINEQRKMKTKISLWGLLAGLLLFGAACSTDDTESIPDGDFQIAEEALSYDFEQRQQIVFIPVQTNIPESEWKLSSSDESWCKISKSYDNRRGLMLAVTESEEPVVREATVKAGAGSQIHTIKVRQLGAGPAILVTNKTLDAAGGDFTIAVTSNIDYTVEEPVIAAEDEAGWMAEKQVETLAARAYAKSEYSYFAQANMLPFVRKATIAVKAVDAAYDEASTEVIVSQNPSEADKNKVVEDTQIFAKGVTGLDGADAPCHAGQEADKLIDGDKESVFHSPWETDNPTTQFPYTLEFTFDGKNNMDYFKIYHKPDGSNGVIGRYELSYKSEGAEGWTKFKEGDLNKNQGGEKFCYFPFTLEGVTGLKFVVLDGAGGNGGFVSAKEIEFYQSSKSTVNEAILNVFTDLSCSELKEGVTREEITRLYAVAPYLAQEVAAVMMENRYEENEAEFRIHTYEPYSDTELYTKFLTRMYSRMDNPTGIEAKVGEEILVCVDKIPEGQYVGLAIYGDSGNGYEPNYSSANQEMELQAGLNVVKVTSGGMCYVMNTTKQLSESSQPVRVHILRGCGTLQGYFDLERHKTDEKYAELLSKCTYKYFVVKGKRMIFNFHVSQLLKDARTNILSGIEAWDNILGWQLELMGLDNVSYFNNHMMAISSTDPKAYMDAAHRRVKFSASTALYKIITYEQLIAQEDNTWGPAHELGHINQGAINWKSCNESSNNLFSNYVIYKMGKYGSRGSKISDLAANYASGKSWVLAGSSTHKNEDTELHMRMNWQLWNYFHRCGVNDEFWPTLFQLLRDDPMPSEFSENQDPGACQLIFYQRACDAAQLDLTEFFETWGFFIPVDIEYEQYGPCRYKVTQEMIDEAKANVAAKKYNPAPAIQYIEDRNVKDGDKYSDMGYYTTFQNKIDITKTITCKVNGRNYTASNNDEAVAIEIRKPEVNGELGKLVYFSNMTNFTVPETVDLSNTVIYAVQWNGKRVKVN